MKKNIILTAIIVSAIIACAIFISDGLTYLVTLLMGLAIMGTINRKPSRVMKITRWAKTNLKTARLFITGLQIALMALGIFAGNNFRELGYEFSGGTAYVFSSIIVAGFLSISFLPKRTTIVIPTVVNRHRWVYMGIALSSFVMMVVFGNKIRDEYPNTPIANAVRAIDQAIFSNNNTDVDMDDTAPDASQREYHGPALADVSSNMAVFGSYIINDKETITSPTVSKKDAREKVKMEKKTKRFERKKQKMINFVLKKRLVLAATLGAGAVILIVLLVITTCAGVCLIIGGFAGGGAGIGYGILGIVVAAASIFGIIKISGSKKKTTKAGP